KRPRTRSRSPYREVRKRKQYSGDEWDSQRYQREDSVASQKNRRSSTTEQSVSERGEPPAVARHSRKDAETQKNQVQAASTAATSNGDDRYVWPSSSKRNCTNVCSSVNGPAETVEEQPAEPIDEAAQLEERRRRREAIRAKYRDQAAPLRIQALHLSGDRDSTPPTSEAVTPSNETPGMLVLCFLNLKFMNSNIYADSAVTPNESNTDPFPELKINKDSDLVHEGGVDGTDKDEPSAADYDPTIDMKAEREKHGQQTGSNEVSAASYD